MGVLPDPDRYLDHVLVHVEPGGGRVDPGPVATWQAWWSQQVADESSWSSLIGAAAAKGFVLSAGDLADAGVSRQRMRTLVRRGTWFAAGYGVVSPVDVRGADRHLVARRRHALVAAAGAGRRPGHVVSCRSAAILQGLPVLHVPDRPELNAPEAPRAGRRAPAHVHAAGLGAGDVTTWFGVLVTTVARTLVDLARHDRRDAIMAADAALRADAADRPAIEAALARAAGWPGVRQAREVLAEATPLAESPLESLTRLVLHDDGFPAPRLQVQVGSYRVDMLFDEQRLILEVDGLAKYTDAESRREKRRAQALRALGYRVERVTWDDVVVRWPTTRTWLRAALALPGPGG
jgi:very-short-patch-repair endonuclease